MGFESGEFEIENAYGKFDELLAEYKKRWWQSDSIKVTIAANISEEFSKAFLKIGVIVPSKIEQNKLTINSEI